MGPSAKKGAFTPERAQFLHGLMDYRHALYVAAGTVCRTYWKAVRGITRIEGDDC